MANFNPSYVGARPDVAKLVPSRCRTILDIGCATGALGQSLKRSRAGLRVFGIELDREMAAVARRSLDEVFEGDILEVLEQKRLGNTRFDCIIFADVLEHLLDPWDALRWLRERHLKPDGVIVALRSWPVERASCWRARRGTTNTVVAKRVRVSPATVGTWRARFLRDRLDGLLDEPRPGAPRTVTDAQVERVVIVTLETTPPGATHWSTRSLAPWSAGRFQGVVATRPHWW